MKRIISVLLVTLFLFSGCGAGSETLDNVITETSAIVEETTTALTTTATTVETTTATESTEETTTVEETVVTEPVDWAEVEKEQIKDLHLRGLDDPDVHKYIEDKVYMQLIDELDSDKYFVDNVKAVYISQEYLDELEYNSKANVYFGYTLDELNQQFEGKKYVFTTDENGKTIAKTFEPYDDTYDKALRDVAIGTGVILVCVTVTAVSGGLGAPAAVTAIFSIAAKTGTAAALSGGALSALSAGAITAIETHDTKQALKAAVSAGARDFKWGAIVGSISGGAAKASSLLHKPILSKPSQLTAKELAEIQKKHKYPTEILDRITSKREYEVFQQAHLKTNMVDGKTALTQKIDLKKLDSKKRTNLQRMLDGLAPLDKNGKPYELHHIGQEIDSPLAILEQGQHQLIPNFKPSTGAHAGSEWIKTRRHFWKDFAEIAMKGGM